MKKPHLKLGDTSRFVKHLIRALRQTSVADRFSTTLAGHGAIYRITKKSNYKHFTRGIQDVVMEFQHRNHLPTTGECDAATWAKLERFL